MKYELTRTAVIGLGGTGQQAVLYMKQRLMSVFGTSIPSCYQFLVLDTADKDSLQGGPEGVIRIEEGEFLKISVNDPGTLIRGNPEVGQWLDNEGNIPRDALVTGAKQVRMLGRLAIFANSKDVDSKITNLISRVRDHSVIGDERVSIKGENIAVNIVGSLGGGTGSGSFLDVAVIARDAPLRAGDKLNGYFLLPDIFADKPKTARVEPNSYAALRELNHFMNKGQYTYQLNAKNRDIGVTEAFFDKIYLINKTNLNGLDFSNQRHLNEVLGVGMFLQSWVTGQTVGNILDNSELDSIDGKRCIFSSFGVSELVYPAEWYAEMAAHKIALETLQSVFLGGDVSLLAAAVDAFVSKAKLNEHGADQVLEALGGRNLVAEYKLSPPFKKDSADNLGNEKAKHIRETIEGASAAVEKNLLRLKDEKVAALREEIAARLSRPQGLLGAECFCSHLKGRILAFREELARERDEAEGRVKTKEPKCDAALERAKTVAGKLFSTGGKIEAELKKYKTAVDELAQLRFEILRRDSANQFFSHLLVSIEEHQVHLKALSGYCQSLVETLGHDKRNLETERRADQPFVEELRLSKLAGDVRNPGPESFLLWLRDTKEIDVLRLASQSAAEFRAVLMEYARADDNVSKARSRTIDDVLAPLTERERLKHLSRLNEMAAPLWRYDTGRVCGPKATTIIALLGVPDEGRTALRPEEIAMGIRSSQTPRLLSTGDPQRIVCVKVEGEVPGFVVFNVERYSEKYENPSSKVPFHLHRDWKGSLEDLKPSEESSEARMWWSLAVADPFKLISKAPGDTTWSFRSELKGLVAREERIPLATSRLEAMRAFLGNPPLVSEARDRIKRIAKEMGENVKVIEALTAWGGRQMELLNDQSEEVRQRVDLELGDIQRYIDNLGEQQ